jgi:bacillithiol system protein YtxJ
MAWKELTQIEQLEDIRNKSFAKPQVIFKHSRRCSLSSMAQSRLERAGFPPNLEFYHLDLITHRDLSNKIAEQFDVCHESPQVLLIRNGQCVYEESHMAIDMSEILEQAEN